MKQVSFECGHQYY